MNDFDHEVHGRLFLTCNCLFWTRGRSNEIASKVSIGSRDARCKYRSVGHIGQVNKSRTQWLMWLLGHCLEHPTIFSRRPYWRRHYLYWSDVVDTGVTDSRSLFAAHFLINLNVYFHFKYIFSLGTCSLISYRFGAMDCMYSINVFLHRYFFFSIYEITNNIWRKLGLFWTISPKLINSYSFQSWYVNQKRALITGQYVTTIPRTTRPPQKPHEKESFIYI